MTGRTSGSTGRNSCDASASEKTLLKAKRGGRDGFTLLEVVIAMALLGLVVAGALQLVSGGLRTSRLSGEYTTALIHGQQKMDEILHSPEPGSGSFTDGFRWVSEVVPIEAKDEDSVEMQQIRVSIAWGDLRKERRIELVSIQVVR